MELVTRAKSGTGGGGGGVVSSGRAKYPDDEVPHPVESEFIFRVNQLTVLTLLLQINPAICYTGEF